MNKIMRFIQNYLIVGLFFVIALMVWSYLQKNSATSSIEKALHEILSWNFMLWFATLIVFLIMLVAIPLAREKTLKRLANLKERDEREQYITGRAARAAYISTLSLMIFFLFFSVFSFRMHHYPSSQAIEHNGGHNYSLAMKIGFDFFDKPEVNSNSTQNQPDDTLVFDLQNITPSKSAMILILLCWQLLIFNFTARKEQIKGLQ